MNKKLVIFLALFTQSLLAESFNCQVVSVTDGDTIRCLTAQKQNVKIRLYQIDAPESKQAYGRRSKQLLSNLVYGKKVIIKTHGLDKYKRTLGTVYTYYKTGCDIAPQYSTCLVKKDINLEMINQGMAWYWPFAKKNKQYKQAEEQAKKDKIGLWADKNPVAPWDFRRNK